MKFKKLWQVLVFCLGIVLMFFVLEKGLGFLENKFFPDVKALNPYFWVVINRLIFTFIGVFILKKLGKINILKTKGKGFWHGVLLGSIMLCPNMYEAFLAIGYMLGQEPELQPISVIITIVCTFLAVGLYEELVYRGIILGVLEEYFGHKSASSVWKAVILSGILFGVFHFGNLAIGANFLYVLNQAIRAVGAGIFWGAVYMRSRNLYSLMFLHAINDTLAVLFLFVAGAPHLLEAMASAQVNFTTFIWTFATVIVEILLAMFLLRKKKMQEIINDNVNLGKTVADKN